MKYKVNINKIAKSLGFTICYQENKRKNILGYIVRGDMNIIVISKLDKTYQRYAVADCLVHYIESDIQDKFYYQATENIYDNEYIELVANLLIPTRGIKRLVKGKNNQELSEYFEVPLFLIDKKLEQLNTKQKKYVK